MVSIVHPSVPLDAVQLLVLAASWYLPVSPNKAFALLMDRRARRDTYRSSYASPTLAARRTSAVDPAFRFGATSSLGGIRLGKPSTPLRPPVGAR